jgi:hypothetical protein
VASVTAAAIRASADSDNFMSAAPFENAPAFCIFSAFFGKTRDAYLDLNQIAQIANCLPTQRTILKFKKLLQCNTNFR